MQQQTKQSDELMTARWLMWIFVAILIVNQYFIGVVGAHMGMMSLMQSVGGVFSVQQASAMEIMMPMLNEDGMTTHLQMMPTITEVSGEQKSTDIVQSAMDVMIASGAPFYAPEGIDFDDAVGALNGWGSYERMEIPVEMEKRYQDITDSFPCNFCCGSAMSVAVNSRCGCAHAVAARGFFRYMLTTYGDTYSNDQLIGEAYRWQAIWYPSGVVEDYLLGTGRGDVLPHKAHGGVGGDGMHGMTDS